MKLLLLILFAPCFASAQIFINANGARTINNPTITYYLDSAQFVFSNTSLAKTGYTNIVGDPVVAIRSGTGAYSIGITSISTARWTAVGGGIAGASDNGGQTGAAYLGYWFRQLNRAGTVADTNMRVTGLVPGAQYQLRAFSSRSGTSDRQCSYIVHDAIGDTLVNGYNVGLNTATYASLGIRTADVNGVIVIACNPLTPYNATHPYAYIGILEIKRWPRL